MAYTKIILFIFLSLNLSAFSKQANKVEKKNFALIYDENEICKAQIRKSLKKMLNSNSLKISKRAFIKLSYLDITNDAEVYKQFLLHVDAKECYVSLVTKSNIIVNSLKLKNCRCKIVGQ